MKKYIFGRIIYFCFPVLIILSSFTASGQSPNYQIESFQDIYTELSTYESIALLTQGDLLWEYEFELDFPFPFYDSLYTSIFYQEEAWGSLSGQDEDVALLLMNFTGAYTYDNVLDTFNIDSDVRFSHMEEDGKQAFVIQFTKNRFFANPFADSLDTYLNFQIWFYADGVVEVHFGEMHMDNTPIYAPGEGFYCYTTSGGVDTNEICGPHMGISNPMDWEDAIALSGSYDDFDVVGNQYSELTVLPPEGWIIRFKPTTVATSDPKNYEHMVISPNPTNGNVHLPGIDGRVVVADVTGRIVYEGYPEVDILDVSFLPSGIYYLRILSKDKILTGKFMRQ